MKTAAMTLALTLGLSAFNTMAQEEGGPPKRDEGPPRRDRQEYQREERRVERAPAKEAEQGRPAEARPNQQQRRERTERWERVAPRGPGLSARGRGQGFVPPSHGRGGFQRSDGVCPECGRPLGPLGLRGRMGTGPGFGRGGRGPGFGPPTFAPGRGLQGRGPGFGPPPWAGRGGPRSEMNPAPDEQRRGEPPMQGRGFGPMHRGPGGPGGPEGRFERGDPDPRFEGRGPANRPPMERDDR